MLLRTHLAVGFAAALYFLPHMNDKTIFFITVIIASVIPEIGNIITHPKHAKLFKKPLKTAFPFGGITRTYTVCLAVSIALAFLYPVLAFPFFLGYSFNLFLNTFTPEGITPFWPFKKKSTGRIVAGGTIDYTIFVLFIIFDVALIVKLFI